MFISFPSSGVRLAPFCFVVALAACVAEPPRPSVVVIPGKGKDAAAFTEDNLVCQRHAAAHTGYAGGAAVASGTGGTSDTVSVGSDTPDTVGYLQCMAARGDTIQPAPSVYAATPYPYGNGYFPGYPYGYPYAYPYGYPGAAFDGGFFLGFSGGGRGHGGFHRGGFAHAGLGRGGGGHGGGGHGGGGHH